MLVHHRGTPKHNLQVPVDTFRRKHCVVFIGRALSTARSGVQPANHLASVFPTHSAFVRFTPPPPSRLIVGSPYSMCQIPCRFSGHKTSSPLLAHLVSSLRSSVSSCNQFCKYPRSSPTRSVAKRKRNNGLNLGLFFIAT